MTTPKTVLVTGATGNQGGAVVDALLNRGMAVRALVRNPSSAKAQALQGRGVELAEGNLNDADSIRSAAQGRDAVWVNTTPFAAGVGIEGELAQGRTIVEALQGAAVPHIVYSSVSDANRSTGVPHFDSKWDAEQRFAAANLPVTVTAPVFFADNVIAPWSVPTLKSGTFRHPMPPQQRLQVVSLRDIGRFNAAVIERGPTLAGRRFNYAGDELNSLEMASALARHSGLELTYAEQPIDLSVDAVEDTALMFVWFVREGYTADIPGLRVEFPEVEWLTFDDWAGTVDWAEVLR